MKKVILVAQTHWDKEWYFNEQTAHVLLQRTFEDIKHKQNFPFHLDGQSSLIDDLFPNSKKDASEFVKKHNVTVGSLFIQQDNYNVMFGTTQNNLEINKRIVDENLISSTIYMPDSFGFNEQQPQIWKKNGFNNFVFWRGIKPEDKKKSNLFNWKGIDGTMINAHCMVDGYWIMGSHYPWLEEKEKQNFPDKLIEHVQKMESFSQQNVYVVPLGGDQAPVPLEVLKYIKKANEQQNNYEFVMGTYDDYFNSLDKKASEEIDYMLYYSGTSKIHRTIHSNRYDIKKAYREAEISVFYRMEPLEVIYSKMGGKVLTQEVKDKRIYKPLLSASAHDSLGGCNLDKTNKYVLDRLDQVLEFAESYIDQMLRDIRENINQSNVYIAFNQAPFKRDLVFKDIISTNNSSLISSENNEIFEYDQYNLSNGTDADIYMHKVLLNVKDVEPFSWKVITLKEGGIASHSAKTSPIKFVENKIILPNSKSFEIVLEDDFGDEFDFSTNSLAKHEVIGNWETSNVKICEDISNTVFYSKDYPELKVSIFNLGHKNIIDIELDNKFIDKKLSMKFTKKSIELSRHLAFIPEKLDEINDWKEKGHKDFPCNVFPHDGLVRIDEKFNILTKGTNEVWIDKDNVSITLARFVGLLGKPNLDYRPGATSGLPFKAHTPESQLHKKLEFNFEINDDNSIFALNNWYLSPMGFCSKHANPIIEKLDRFIWNKHLLDLTQKPSVNFKANKVLLGMMKLDDKQISIAYSNPYMIDQGNIKKAEIIYEKNKL